MTSPAPWTAERTVTVDGVHALVAALLPELAGAPVHALAEGWDNSVFVVGEWALRFPRRRIALPGIRREIDVLPVIAPLLPLSIPVPVLAAYDHHPAEPWPFTAVRLIEGRELAEAGLTAADRTPVAAQVGGFLRVLHTPEVREAAVRSGADLPVDPLQRSWPRARLAQTREVLDRLVRDGGSDVATARLLARAAALEPSTAAPVLVHGDLHLRHVLVAGDGSVAGVIDWGDVCLADPAVDLSILYAAFERDARAAALEAYGPVGEDTELRARALAVRLCAILADYARRDDRPALLAEALHGLDRAGR